MKKFLTLLFVLLIAIIISGGYGILHDQLSYTISSEYFTKFKFIQFGLDDWGFGQNIGTKENPEIFVTYPHYAAGIVGFLATWWMGLIIGFVLGLIGLRQNNYKIMFRITMKSLWLSLGITVLCGSIGLAFGWFLFTPSMLENYYFLPDNLIDKQNFIAVGTMHNAGYFGSFVGLIVSIVFSLKKKLF